MVGTTERAIAGVSCGQFGTASLIIFEEALDTEIVQRALVNAVMNLRVP
jgi:hypothetical protein